MIGIIAILFLYGCGAGKNNFGQLGSAHKHADIKVYVSGNQIDLGLPKYQLQSKMVHFEDGDGDVVHVHATGITLGYMLETLGINIGNECLTLDTGNRYCTNDNAKLGVFAKGKGTDWEQISYPDEYVIQDMDKILVNYGAENEEGINKLMGSVTNKSSKG